MQPPSTRHWSVRCFRGWGPVRVMWQRISFRRVMGCCWLAVRVPGASSSSVGVEIPLRQRGAMYGVHKWAMRILTNF